ncbi:MAG: response regulator [Bacillota bacterium]
MKILIVEDDFVSRCIMQEILSPYGQCDVAVNGNEAYQAFCFAFEQGKPYNLICMDIMMPEMNGQDTLKKIREYESAEGVKGANAVKIIMTTALGDSNNIKNAFIEQCEAYLIKPISKAKLLDIMKKLELIS